MTERKPDFIALIGDQRIPTTAAVIAAYLKATGTVPFEYVPADPEQVAKDERTL